jgi:hypothetical protein
VVYTPSVREYHYPEVPEYPFQDRTIEVTQCGRICIGRRKINLSTVFGGQYVGIREVADSIWLISFMDYDPGFFDEEHNTLGPVGENPLAPRVLPMSSERTHRILVGVRGFEPPTPASQILHLVSRSF